ncbi:hypothetical protein HSB1_47960 [Halogranum salarium B-1]|uniref:Uncharacterized protein n=1 Tax=Halogranum salarium B-1 TaxID=1210908 RepID=J3JCX0_9EURY|nr:hypothetical protein HSB1_47960 [Halogranum salarium B-1]
MVFEIQTMVKRQHQFTTVNDRLSWLYKVREPLPQLLAVNGLTLVLTTPICAVS